MRIFRSFAGRACLGCLCLVPTGSAWDQTVGSTASGTAQQERILTLDEAISLATANEPAFAAAQAEIHAAKLDRTNARVALLPTATYHNQALYTKPNGVSASRIGQTANAAAPSFIANNAVREYASQGVFDETVGFGKLGAIKLANANAMRAEAEFEIARRGLVNAVVALYYDSGATAEKVTIAERGLAEADRFLDIAQKRESAREAAHADVLKAQSQQQQRQRDLVEAHLGADKARLELAVLLYPDPTIPFTLAPPVAPALPPDRTAVETLARQNNPEIGSALASRQASKAETYSARASLLPNLGLNFTYGIDATNFGVNGPDGIRNLGYSMSAQLDIPVWDWLTTERTIKQSRLRENATKVALTAAERRLIANLAEFYAEADAAQRQMASYDASLVTARESLRLTTLRYVDGESTVLEVVDAQGTLISAENAQIESRVRYQLALANLQTLTGRR
jgi:outer membrane protein TolC